MKTHAFFTVVAALFAALTLASPAHAQSALVTIDTVTVRDPGNAGLYGGEEGAVAYEFDIGKYEVTIGQYAAFLNAVAMTDPHNLYNEQMASDLNIAGIMRNGSPGSYTYSVITNSGNSANRPMTYVSWFDAARFCNWLHNGATNGADTETGAYTLMGVQTGRAPAKNSGAKWWLPTASEWFKAAFYKGGGTNAGYWSYPTRSDTAPGNVVGNLANQANYFANDYSVTQTWVYSASQNYLTSVGAFSSSFGVYGTFDQAGGVLEWNDPDGGLVTDWRQLRGGSWNGESVSSNTGVGSDTSVEFKDWGFRVARAATGSLPPQPTTNALLVLERASSPSGIWETMPLGPEMITQDGRLNAGALTNRSYFYRMRIQAVAQ